MESTRKETPRTPQNDMEARAEKRPIDAASKTWGEAKVLAADRHVWQRTVEALCSREGAED